MIIYKTTNILNGLIYVGQSINNDPYYIGSGRLLKKAIKEFGKRNFKKEILEYCNNKFELDEKEKYWIDFLDSKNPEIGYNIIAGGTTGWKNMNEERKREFYNKKSEQTKGENNPFYKKHHTEETRKIMSENHIDISGDKNPNYGKTTSEKTKKLMSDKKKGY